MSLKANSISDKLITLANTDSYSTVLLKNSDLNKNNLSNESQANNPMGVRFKTEKIIVINKNGRTIKPKDSSVNLDQDDPEYIKEMQRPAVIKVIF